jgi:2-keto-4-pentenoate hydratase/2-oxohepta-3-ene-1,7-dioic acid hydratase in catechol pathway
MRLARYRVGDAIRHGVVEGDRVRDLLRPFLEGIALLETAHPLDEVELLAPVRPGKMLCVGVNYRDHAEEMGHALPEEPILFMKPATALLGPDRPIVYPAWIGRMDYEAEMALVVGRRCRGVSEEDADDCILGYTCFNDVTARDLQARDGQWTRAKSFDTFGVIGPWIETDPGDPGGLAVTGRLNGEVRQASSSEQLIFGPRALLAWTSRVMTLEPGDVIATGTPAGVGAMKPGDVVEVEVEGVGVLRNTVVAERGGGPRPTRVR